MNELDGHIFHKAEMLEMDFLRENGINPDYNKVENHIEKLCKIFDEKCDDITVIETNVLEEMESDLEDKCNAIDSVSSTLYDMKRFVESMRKSEIRTTLLSYIEDMEMDVD